MLTASRESKFPLWLHKGTGQWTRKVRGRQFYFGADRDAARKEWDRVGEDLLAGRSPRAKTENALPLRDAANQFLTSKRSAVDAGELSARQWAEYHATCQTVLDAFGVGRAVADLRPEDFGRLRAVAAARLGPFALSKFIQMVRTFFKFAFENGLIDVPVRYGQSLDKPRQRTLRLAREAAGSRMLAAADARKLLDAADPTMRAAILLALNCGYGQSDLAGLTRSALTRAPGWAVYPRPKTGIARRCPLWPETREAIAALPRPVPQDPADAECVFLTPHGRRLVRFRGEPAGGVKVDYIPAALKKLAQSVGVSVRGFYSLRHVHRTVSDGARDRVASDLIMGHRDASMGALYREGVDDARLIVVVGHVRSWLFAGGAV
ncbi:MAG TPA: hypothetical protein VGJ05_08840 [Fimbriiglobus sp.]|jgi:integrase